VGRPGFRRQVVRTQIMDILAASLSLLTVPGAWIASRIYLRRNVPTPSLQKHRRVFSALEICVEVCACAISFAGFVFFTWFMYEGLSQHRIHSLSKVERGIIFYQESTPFLYWIMVALSYFIAAMLGSVLFVCATIWRANRKRSP